MHMQKCFRKKENRREYQCGERLICRKYTKIHDVFNVHFQNDIVKIMLEGKLLLKNYSKSRIPQAILTENAAETTTPNLSQALKGNQRPQWTQQLRQSIPRNLWQPKDHNGHNSLKNLSPKTCGNPKTAMATTAFRIHPPKPAATQRPQWTQQLRESIPQNLSQTKDHHRHLFPKTCGNPKTTMDTTA